MSGGIFWNSSKCNNTPIRFYNFILAFLSKQYFSQHSARHTEVDGSICNQLQIPIYSEYRRNGLSYRCHPNYRSGNAYYDWCYIRWWNGDNPETGAEEYVNLIGQILLFYQHPDDDSIHAIVHSVQADTKENYSVFSEYWHMETEGPVGNQRPILCTVPVEALEKHVLMVRMVEGNEYRWIHIIDQNEWPQCFKDIE
jgi:hypothetical protein